MIIGQYPPVLGEKENIAAIAKILKSFMKTKHEDKVFFAYASLIWQSKHRVPNHNILDTDLADAIRQYDHMKYQADEYGKAALRQFETFMTKVEGFMH